MTAGRTIAAGITLAMVGLMPQHGQWRRPADDAALVVMSPDVSGRITPHVVLALPSVADCVAVAEFAINLPEFPASSMFCLRLVDERTRR